MSERHSDAEHLAIRLRATVSQLTRRLRNGTGTDSPGAAKLGVLGQLYRLGPLTPTALAQREQVRLQTLTRLLAELDGAGLVRRRPDPHDARRTLLTLTAAGTRVLTADVRRREASLAAAIVDRLSEDEQAALRDACELVDRLADGLDDAHHAPAARANGRQRTARPSGT